MRWFGLKSFSLWAVLLLASTANGAITPNLSHGSSVVVTSSNTYTFGFSCDATSDLIVFSWLTYKGTTGENVSSLTYNSVSMSQALTINGPGGDLGETVFIYYLKGSHCDGASHNFVITLGATSSYGGIATYSTFSGVNQTTPIGNTGTNGSASENSPFSASITTASDSYAYDCLIVGANSLTVGGSQTQISNDLFGSETGASSYLLNASSMSWTNGSTGIRVAQGVIEIKAAGATPAPNIRHRVITP